MDADIFLKAELVATLALYLQSAVDGNPAVREVARLTQSDFYFSMIACEDSLDLTQEDVVRYYGQALTEFWAAKLDVARDNLLVEYDGFCQPANKLFRW